MEVYATVMAFPVLLAYMDVIFCICTGKRIFRWGALLLDFVILVLPPLLLFFYDVGDNRGNYTIIFPSHRPVVYALILLCLVVYFYAMWRKKLAAPLLEALIHCFLLLGVALNILIAIRMWSPDTLFLINLPAALLLIVALVRNHRLLIHTKEDVDVLEPARNGWTSSVGWHSVCRQWLRMAPVERTAVLIAISLPVFAPLARMFLSAGRIH